MSTNVLPQSDRICCSPGAVLGLEDELLLLSTSHGRDPDLWREGLFGSMRQDVLGWLLVHLGNEAIGWQVMPCEDGVTSCKLFVEKLGFDPLQLLPSREPSLGEISCQYLSFDFSLKPGELVVTGGFFSECNFLLDGSLVLFNGTREIYPRLVIFRAVQ